MAKGTLEDMPIESMEKWPPGWADHEYDPDDLDDEQENKRIGCLPARLKTIK